MSKKKRCPICGQDLTNQAYIGINLDGKVAKCHPACANEVLKRGKKDFSFNRSLNNDFVSVRKR